MSIGRLGVIGAAFAWVVLFPAMSPSAEESAPTPREKMLLDKVTELEKRVAELEKRLSPEAPPPQPLPDVQQRIEKGDETIQQQREKSPADFRVFWKDGLRLETEDKRFALRIGGRLQTDWAFFDQDRDLERVLGDEEDGTEFRRARINLSGTIYHDVEYRTEYDFAGNSGKANFYDVYIGMKNIPALGTLRLGHFREPFGLERLTSVGHITFMERALPNAFTPGRNVGLMGFNSAFDDRVTWAVGAYKNTDNFPSGDDADEDQGYAVTGRVTALPWYQDDGGKLLHVGVAYSHRNPDGAVLGYGTRPEAHLGRQWVTTEGYGGFRLRDARMDDVDLWGGEALLIYGPLSLQGEYMRANVDTTFLGRHDFDGYYVQASYFLTGEHRAYTPSSGLPGRIKPKSNFSLSGERGWGAWELALRYSTIDLDDRIIRGGQQDDFTAGVSWYLNPNAKIMWNYVLADIDHDLYAGNLDIFETRFQIDF